ncbi:MAG: hypothetical protein OEY66_00855 [Gammaproteobacteria bacterium]|nr:hypothetical protein [Gammaproteobacteria bacterium]
MLKKNLLTLALAATATGISSTASAYSLVYSPTVEYGETEVELYAQRISDDNPVIDGTQQYVIEFGKGVTPNLFLEVKVEIEKKPNQSRETEAVAIEGIYQLTEQGEYSWDVGLLAEVEYSTQQDELKEIEFGPILATEIGSNMTFTTNLIAEYEKAEKKIEGSVNAQLKWRLSQSFEPAIEVYADEYSKSMGPVVMGKIKTESAKFGYQLGWLFGLNDETADNTLKMMVEYEF